MSRTGSRRALALAVVAVALFVAAGGTAVGVALLRGDDPFDFERNGFDRVAVVSGITLYGKVGFAGVCSGIELPTGESSEGCGPVIGIEPLPLDDPIVNHLTYHGSSLGRAGSYYVSGVVSLAVERVEIELAGGRVLRPQLHPAPAAQQPVPFRFFLVDPGTTVRPAPAANGRHRPDTGVREIRSYDAGGRLLDRFPFPICLGDRADTTPGQCRGRTARR